MKLKQLYGPVKWAFSQYQCKGCNHLFAVEEAEVTPPTTMEHDHHDRNCPQCFSNQLKEVA